MSSTLDVEQFITEVEKYPELWDINCEEYRHKNKKQAAWARVARNFLLDFEDMNEAEKDNVYKKLFNKWRNIRDSYVRHMKRKDEGKKGYMYARNLSFLHSIYSGKQTASDEEWTDDDTKALLYKPKIEFAGWAEEDNSVDVLKRKRKATEIDFEETSLQLTDPATGYPVAVEDQDRSFFESLLPAVRDFDLDQKLEFRCEVIKLVKRIRNGQRSS